MSYESITKRTASLQKVQSWFYDPGVSFPHPGKRTRIFLGAIGIVQAKTVNVEMPSWGRQFEFNMLSYFIYSLPRTTLTYDEGVTWGFFFWTTTIGQLIAVYVLPRCRWAPEEEFEALMTVPDLPLRASGLGKTLRSVWYNVIILLITSLTRISLLIQVRGLTKGNWARNSCGDGILELIYDLWFISVLLLTNMKQRLPKPLADWC
jgi:hypothetical protein